MREHFHLLRVIFYKRSLVLIYNFTTYYKSLAPPRLNALPVPAFHPDHRTAHSFSTHNSVCVYHSILVYGSDEGASQMLHTPYRTLNTPQGLGGEYCAEFGVFFLVFCSISRYILSNLGRV